MSFIQFARAHGIEIDPAKLYPGEKIKRCGTTEKPRSSSGAYFWDGQRGWVFNWSDQAQVQWFNDPSAQPWTQAEKDTWRAKRQAQRIQQEQGYQRAAQQAAEMLRSATPGEHNYLHSKGFALAQGLIAPDGALLIPMRHHQTNALQGVQAAVLMCFSAHNLIQVAQSVQGRACVFADHDKSGTGQTAAEQTGLPWCMSPIEGEDANDLHQRAGLLAVRQLLMQVRLQGRTK